MVELDLGSPKELQRLMLRRQSSMRLIMSNCKSSLQLSLSYLYWSQSSRVSSIPQNKLQDQRYYINKSHLSRLRTRYLPTTTPAGQVIDGPSGRRLIDIFGIGLCLKSRNWLDYIYWSHLIIKFIAFRTIILLFQTTMALQSPKQTQQQTLINILLGEHDSNQRVQAMRQSELVREEKYIRRQSAGLQIRDISEKLNRLEKTLFKKNQLDKGTQDVSSNRKYEELNMIHGRLRKVLSKLGNSKSSIDVQNIERNVIGLYNESVAVLNNQSKLSRKLAHLKQQNQLIASGIDQTKADILRTSLELESIESLKDMNLRRLERLSKCPFLYN